jgi:hypothetical protein
MEIPQSSDDFEAKMIEEALATITPRQVFVLSALAAGCRVVRDGAYAYVGNDPTSVRTLNALLRFCAVTFEKSTPANITRLEAPEIKFLRNSRNVNSLRNGT